MSIQPPVHRQRGAVAIMTALSLLLLIAMIGLVVDLGYLYTRKTELQNAADAAPWRPRVNSRAMRTP